MPGMERRMPVDNSTMAQINSRFKTKMCQSLVFMFFSSNIISLALVFPFNVFGNVPFPIQTDKISRSKLVVDPKRQAKSKGTDLGC